MKRLFCLIKPEIGFLKKTLLFIGIILTIFSAALLSVVSVLIDVPEGLYVGIDQENTFFYCTVNDANIRSVRNYGGTYAYARRQWITEEAVLMAPSTGRYFRNYINVQGENVTRFRGYVVTSDSYEALGKYDDSLIDGNWINAAGQICLARSVAYALDVKVGDVISLSAYELKVTGIYDYAKTEGVSCEIPQAYYYLVLPETAMMDVINVDYTCSQDADEACRTMVRDGLNASLPSYIAVHVKNIALVEAFFSAVVAVLGVMVMFVIYSLITLFYRQRRVQICRLKLLGASDGTIAGIYCSIALALVIVSTIIAAALSILFNQYFISLCAILYGNTFTSHFYIAIPAILLAVLGLFTILLFAVYNRRIVVSAIAAEVRHE